MKKAQLVVAGIISLIIASFSIGNIPLGAKAPPAPLKPLVNKTVPYPTDPNNTTPLIPPVATPSPSPTPSPIPSPTPPPPPAGSWKLSGYRWDLTKYPHGVDFVVNPTYPVSQGLTEAQVLSALQKGLDSWDMAVNKEVFNHTLTVDYNATVKTDSRNVITWRPLSPLSTVAVSNMVYSNGKLLETDIVFNTAYMWGVDPDGEGPITLAQGVMDLCNIATHESGHCLGLDDIYDQAYSMVTMYGYTRSQETLRISLTVSDVYGARQLYL